jgi:hypothetical protein
MIHHIILKGAFLPYFMSNGESDGVDEYLTEVIKSGLTGVRLKGIKASNGDDVYYSGK